MKTRNPPGKETSPEILALAGRIRAVLRRAKKGKSPTIVIGFYENGVWVSIPDPFTAEQVDSCMQSLITQARGKR